VRIKAIHVHNHVFEIAMTEGYEINHSRVVEGIPKGATLVNVHHADFGREVVLLFRHDSFAEVPDNLTAPIMDVKVEDIPPVEFSPKFLLKEERQALYEELHNVYNCRIYYK